MRDLIASGEMSPHRAVSFLNDLDDTKPWYSKLEYIQGVTSMAAVFEKEMSRKTYQQGRDIRSILMSSCTADKIAWYWNNQIIRHRMTRAMVALLGSGASPNESLHHEVNTWWRSQPELFPNHTGAPARCGVAGQALGAQRCHVQSNHQANEAQRGMGYG